MLICCQVVKEEVVESCIIEDNGAVVEMTLPGSVFTTSAAAIINSLPQVPVPLTSSATSQGSYQLTVNLPTVPVASMQNQTQQIQVRCRYRSYILLHLANLLFSGSRHSLQPRVIITAAPGPGCIVLTPGQWQLKQLKII